MIKGFILLCLSISIWASQPTKEPFENGVYIIDGDTPVYHLDELKRIKTAKRMGGKMELIINKLASGILDKCIGSLLNEIQILCNKFY